MRGATSRGTARRPTQPHGAPGERTTGRIVKMLVGQGHGFIRMADERGVFFHRADLEDGAKFNDLRVGDPVTFELFEDAVSGARALHVARRRRSR